MIIESRNKPSCGEHPRDRPMDAKAYVRKKLAEHLDVSSSEIISTDELTNLQACNLMADAEIYFGFHSFLHKSTFLEGDPHFTVLQCIKLIRLQLGEFDYLLGGKVSI